MDSLPQRIGNLFPGTNRHRLTMTNATHLHKRTDTPTADIARHRVHRDPVVESDPRRDQSAALEACFHHEQHIGQNGDDAIPGRKQCFVIDGSRTPSASTGSRDEGPRSGLYKWELIYPKGPWTGLSNINARNTRLRRLVMTTSASTVGSPRTWLHDTCKPRSRPRPSRRLHRSGGDSNRQVSMKPGAIQCHIGTTQTHTTLSLPGLPFLSCTSVETRIRSRPPLAG